MIHSPPELRGVLKVGGVVVRVWEPGAWPRSQTCLPRAVLGWSACACREGYAVYAVGLLVGQLLCNRGLAPRLLPGAISSGRGIVGLRSTVIGELTVGSVCAPVVLVGEDGRQILVFSDFLDVYAREVCGHRPLSLVGSHCPEG